MALVSDQVSEISVSSHFDSMLMRRHETFKGGEGATLFANVMVSLCIHLKLADVIANVSKLKCIIT